MPVESGWIGGMTFGSQHLQFVKHPEIALVGGPSTVASSYASPPQSREISSVNFCPKPVEPRGFAIETT